MTSVQAKAVVKDGKLTVDPLGAALYGGKVAGLLALDGSSDVPALTFRQSLDGVQVGSLLGDMADVDRLTGKAAMSLNLNTAGTTSEDLISALDGDINFEMADGMIRGFNITHALQSAVAGMALSVIGMLLAAAGYLSPVAGAITQEVIDVLAVLNALRVALPPKSLTDY